MSSSAPGARRVPSDDHRRRRPAWLWPLLVLLALLIALGIILALVLGNGDDDDGNGTAGRGTIARQAGDGTRAPESDGSSAGGGAAGAGQAGQLTAGGTSLLSLPPARLGSLSGRQVQARSVRVESVPADEGFWVGSNASRRVFVHLRRGDESPFQVRRGETVSFSGVAQPLDSSEEFGVEPSKGGTLLRSQGWYVEVQSGTLEQG